MTSSCLAVIYCGYRRAFLFSGDYNLIDCYTVIKNDRVNPGIILFGVEVISYNVKGILIYHNKNHELRPPAITQKLAELRIAHLKTMTGE